MILSTVETIETEDEYQEPTQGGNKIREYNMLSNLMTKIISETRQPETLGSTISPPHRNGSQILKPGKTL